MCVSARVYVQKPGYNINKNGPRAKMHIKQVQDQYQRLEGEPNVHCFLTVSAAQVSG
jgi:hypothetical protein